MQLDVSQTGRATEPDSRTAGQKEIQADRTDGYSYIHTSILQTCTDGKDRRRQTEIDGDRGRERRTESQAGRQADRQTDRQRDKQTDRLTDKKTDRQQTDRQTARARQPKEQGVPVVEN